LLTLPHMLLPPYLYASPSSHPLAFFLLFFFNHPAPPDIYTLSLHDALPIWRRERRGRRPSGRAQLLGVVVEEGPGERPFVHFIVDRKSTRLNSSHQIISYAVFCLKKKKKKKRY